MAEAHLLIEQIAEAAVDGTRKMLLADLGKVKKYWQVDDAD